MVDLFNLFFQICRLPVFQPVCHKEGKSACTKFIDQDILTLHGIDLIRQIYQQIIIDPGMDVANGCGDCQ